MKTERPPLERLMLAFLALLAVNLVFAVTNVVLTTKLLLRHYELQHGK